MTSFGEIKRNILSEDQINQFRTLGYLVVDHVATEKECDIMLEAIVNFANKSVFELEKEEPQLDLKKLESFSILTDEKLSNTSHVRSTKIPKSNGMLNGYFIPEVQVLCMSNPNIYNVFRQLLGQDELLLLPERVGIKAKGSTDMKEHLDIDLLDPFRESVHSESSQSIFSSPTWNQVHGRPRHFNDRVQGFLNILIDETIEPRNSGTLCLVTHWCLYWELLQQIFHFETGLAGYKMNKDSNLPYFFNNGIDLAPLNRYIKFYTNLQENPQDELPKSYRKGSIEEHAWLVFKKLKIIVPTQVQILERTPIPAKRGSLVIWNGAPHQNLRNNSKIPRVVAYVDFRKLPTSEKEIEDFYNTNEFQLRKESIMGLKGWHGRSKSNQIELEVSKKFYSQVGTYPGPYTLHQTYNSCLCSPLYKALMGFDKNTGETFTWEMFKNETT